MENKIYENYQKNSQIINILLIFAIILAMISLFFDILALKYGFALIMNSNKYSYAFFFELIDMAILSIILYKLFESKFLIIFLNLFVSFIFFIETLFPIGSYFLYFLLSNSSIFIGSLFLFALYSFVLTEAILIKSREDVGYGK